MSSCTALFTLTFGHEYSPESISLEGGSDTILRLPVIGVLVRSPDGWFLLETGLNPAYCRDPTLFRTIYPFGDPELEGNDPLIEQLARCGVDLAGIAGVAVSHLHVDHAGGLPRFAGGPPITVQRRELDYALNRAGEPQAYWRPDYASSELDWRVIDGDTSIAAGIDAIATPGHTPGHMSYRVRMAESGTWLFAIDAIDLAQGIQRDRPIGWSADETDAPSRRSSHDRLVAMAHEEDARLVPGHCPVTWPALRCPPDGYS
jgi:N-acyl homoserine lactone hydrolase